MMWREDLAEFDLAFESMPDAVHHTQAFEERNRAVCRGAIDDRCAGSGELCGSGGAFAQKLLEDSLAGKRVTIAGIFQYIFKTISHIVEL